MEDSVCNKNTEHEDNFFKKRNTELENRVETKYNINDSKEKNIKKKKIKKNNKKCPVCIKKLTLVQREYKCKCNKSYCSKHRLSHQHNCDFDYIKENQQNLEINNPDMSFKKIDKLD